MTARYAGLLGVYVAQEGVTRGFGRSLLEACLAAVLATMGGAVRGYRGRR